MQTFFIAVGVIATFVLVGSGFCVIAWGIWQFMFSAFGPMLHFGKPKMRGELVFYDRRVILSRKGGDLLTKEELAEHQTREEPNHKFAVPWFAGLSTRKGHFLLGFIRLVRQ